LNSLRSQQLFELSEGCCRSGAGRARALVAIHQNDRGAGLGERCTGKRQRHEGKPESL
jgi:hypothetical protein